MKKLKIEIRETLSAVIKVETDSLETAIIKAQKKYDNEEIVLDYNNHINTDIDIAEFDILENNTEFANFILENAEKMIPNLSLEELAKIGFGSLINAINEYEKIK